MMPNGDSWDRFFYPTLTLMIDSYTITSWAGPYISSVIGVCVGGGGGIEEGRVRS